MSKITSLLCICLLIILSGIPIISNAAEAGDLNVSAKVNYPYHRAIKRKTVVVLDPLSSGWADMETREEAKVGRSAFFNFIVDNTVPKVPPFTNLIAKEKSSKKDSTINSPEYISRYHRIGCKTEHNYKLYGIPVVNSSDDRVDAKLRTVCKATSGYDGIDTGYQVVEYPPSIDLKQTRGEFKIEKILETNKVTYDIKQESKAVLMLVTPPENLCVKFSRQLVNMCAKGAVSHLLPGGFIISQSGIVTKITAELENLIFKSDPVWSVPIKVDASILTPRLNEELALVYDTTSVPCSSIKVLNKNLNADCTTNVLIREKQMIKDVTPTVSGAKYYSFNVAVNGSPVKSKSNIFADIAGSLVATAYQANEGGVSLDDEGFMLVPGDNAEYLPLTTHKDEVRVDTSAPTIPGRPIASDIGYNNIRLSWVNSNDNVGVVEYRLFMNGIHIATPITNYYLVSNLNPNTNYTFSVLAVDKALNISRQSQSSQVKTLSAVDKALNTSRQVQSSQVKTLSVTTIPQPIVVPPVPATMTPPSSIEPPIIVTPIPTITSILPLSAKPGETISLSGKNLLNGVLSIVSASNSSRISPDIIYSSSESSLVFKMPNLQAGTYYVDLTTSSGTSNRLSISVTSVVEPATQITTPFISSISPSAGKFGDHVTLTGVNFDGVMSDLLYIENSTGSIGPELVSSSATSITFKVPNIPTGAYKVWMFVDKGESNKVDFTVQSSLSSNSNVMQVAAAIEWLIPILKVFFLNR